MRFELPVLAICVFIEYDECGRASLGMQMPRRYIKIPLRRLAMAHLLNRCLLVALSKKTVFRHSSVNSPVAPARFSVHIDPSFFNAAFIEV